jgi:hypothetical protein
VPVAHRSTRLSTCPWLRRNTANQFAKNGGISGGWLSGVRAFARTRPQRIVKLDRSGHPVSRRRPRSGSSIDSPSAFAALVTTLGTTTSTVRTGHRCSGRVHRRYSHGVRRRISDLWMKHRRSRRDPRWVRCADLAAALRMPTECRRSGALRRRNRLGDDVARDESAASARLAALSTRTRWSFRDCLADAFLRPP